MNPLALNKLSLTCVFLQACAISCVAYLHAEEKTNITDSKPISPQSSEVSKIPLPTEKSSSRFGLKRLKNHGSFDLYWVHFNSGQLIRFEVIKEKITIVVAVILEGKISSSKEYPFESLNQNLKSEILIMLDTTAQSYPSFPISMMEKIAVNDRMLYGKMWGMHYIAESSIIEIEAYDLKADELHKMVGDNKKVAIRHRDFTDFSNNFNNLIKKISEM